ncbi:lipopolysaccharide biosynthesis protein, partial [Streptomyces sp. NPDC089919]
AVHRTDLVRIRELISGAGGTVLGAVLHGGQPRSAMPPHDGLFVHPKPDATDDTVPLRTVWTGSF